jgi:predicted MFS family arabinose efflux permease
VTFIGTSPLSNFRSPQHECFNKRYGSDDGNSFNDERDGASLCVLSGAIVANIYYAQPIISLIAPDIGMSNGSASFIVSLTQIGYALGLFFLVPLADLMENRRLMIATIVVTIFSLIAAGLARQPSVFLVVSALIGFSSVSVQMLIPLAAHLAPEESRGRVVGGIMGGLLLGIPLARPLSSLVADHFGWRAVFISARLR